MRLHVQSHSRVCARAVASGKGARGGAKEREEESARERGGKSGHGSGGVGRGGSGNQI